jgi:hypothetical protein
MRNATMLEPFDDRRLGMKSTAFALLTAAVASQVFLPDPAFTDTAWTHN